MTPQCGDPLVFEGEPRVIEAVYPGFFILDNGRTVWR